MSITQFQLDELWQCIEPLLPKAEPRYRHAGGRQRPPDRNVLCGILFVLPASALSSRCDLTLRAK